MTDTRDAKAAFAQVWDPRLKWTVLACVVLLVLVLPIRSTTSIRDGLIILAAVAWAARLKLKGREAIARSGLELGFALFGLAILVSLFFSINLKVSLKELRGEFLKDVLLFYLVFCNLRSERDAGAVYRALIFCSIVFGLGTVAVFAVKAGPKIISQLDKKPFMYVIEHVVIVMRSGGLRDSGGQVAGLYHSLFIAFLAGYLMARTREFSRPLLAAALALNAVAIILTFSRGAWLALVVELLVLAYLFYGKRGLVCALVPLFLLGMLFFKAGFFLRIGEVISPGKIKTVLSLSPEEVEDAFTRGSSLGHRMGSLKYNLDIVLKSPFRPHGFGRDMDRKRDLINPFKPRYTDPHNSFLGLAYQLGVQGLLAFLFLIFLLMKRLRPEKYVEGWPRAAALITSTMVLGFMVNIFFGSFYGDDQALMFWLLGGLGMNAAGGFAR